MRSDPSANRWRFPLSDVRLPPEAVAAAVDVLESGWLSSGPWVERFEASLAEYVGTTHAVACSSGTAALELAYDAVSLEPGDEVIIPSLNFVAAANMVARRGARPVLADVIGEDDLTLDPAAAEALVGPRTRAVVAMHFGGYPCRDEVFRFAASQGLPVIEDAAHALGARSLQGRCGSLGALGCFSFYANKNLPLGEGGAVTTDDESLAATVRSLRSHGMTTSTWQRHFDPDAAYDVLASGINARIDEQRAALGSVLLGQLDELNDRRASAAATYRHLLARVEGVRVPFAERPESERPAHHVFCVVLDVGVDRRRVRAELGEAGIQTSVHYPPIHRLAAFSSGAHPDVARTEALADRLLTLPLHPHLEDSHVASIADALEQAILAAREGTRR